MLSLYTWAPEGASKPSGHSMVVKARKWLAGLAIGSAALVGACQTTGLTPAQQVYGLQKELDTVLAEVEMYAAQPPCDPELGIVVACHEPEVLDIIVPAAVAADANLDAAEAAVRAGGDQAPVATHYIELARAALAQISAALIRREVIQ